MMLNDYMPLLTIVGGIAVSVIGYFLKQTMEELKEVKKISYTTATKLEVLERDYFIQIKILNERFEGLSDSINELTREIVQLSNKLNK